MVPIAQTNTTSVIGVFAAITPTATFIENRLRLDHPSKLVALGLHCFCAYSATIDWGMCTRGVAPGSKLLRFQRALLAWCRPAQWLPFARVYIIRYRPYEKNFVFSFALSSACPFTAVAVKSRLRFGNKNKCDLFCIPLNLHYLSRR